jgi:integrative and conjugative element protein (TIGR02256 family)
MQQESLDNIWLSDGIRDLVIPFGLLDKLTSYINRNNHREQGGILLGLVFKDHDEIVEFVSPSSADRADLLSFIRRRKPAQKKINKAWNKSGGYVIYLGEWHTHPGSAPGPSQQDCQMIKETLQTTRMEIDYLYLVITGKGGAYWAGRQDNDDLRTLKVISRS